MSSRLGLDPEDLVTCVGCGLCLPHCPTYRVTGLEIASPRGRIAAMRAVEQGAPLDATFAQAMDECIQCRGCEPACPSSVPYGRLIEGVQTTRFREHRRAPAWRRMGEWLGYRVILPRHWLLIAASWILWAAQRLRLVPRSVGLPRLEARALLTRTGVRRSGAPQAWLFTGCVMDAWQRPVHRDAAEVLAAAGVTCGRPGAAGACCGALHQHAGRHDEAVALARRTMASMPGQAPIVVDSAGCGAAMKDYGRLLGSDEAHRFAGRVRDFSEFLAAAGPLDLRPTGTVVVVQDPCHLRHVQRAHQSVRTVLAGTYLLTETDDDGLCCGAGGAYAQRQPDLAREVRDRKVAALRRAAAGADLLVASSNPGCAMHLAGAGVSVCHPAQLLAAALREQADQPRPDPAQE